MPGSNVRASSLIVSTLAASSVAARQDKFWLNTATGLCISLASTSRMLSAPLLPESGDSANAAKLSWVVLKYFSLVTSSLKRRSMIRLMMSRKEISNGTSRTGIPCVFANSSSSSILISAFSTFLPLFMIRALTLFFVNSLIYFWNSSTEQDRNAYRPVRRTSPPLINLTISGASIIVTPLICLSSPSFPPSIFASFNSSAKSRSFTLNPIFLLTAINDLCTVSYDIV